MASEGKQHFHGSLGDIARAPGTAVVLLDAVWNCQMNHAIVNEPRKDAVHPRDGVMFVRQFELLRIGEPACALR